MRRVGCPQCGVTVEQVPWADGKNQLTKTYQWFLARWSKRLSWREVAQVFHTTWESVFRSVKMAVQWGLKHRDLSGIEPLGVDEVQWRKGHKYLTLVYQIDGHGKRLLWVGRDRTAKTLLRFFRMLGRERSATLKFVCSDMWQPYLKVIAKKAGQAIHILDRYHIMAKMNQAIDEVRAEEAKRLKQKGEKPVLKHARWCLLKRPENLTARQTVKLSELLKGNLRSVRASLLREDFQRFWEYRSPFWAKRFLAHVRRLVLVYPRWWARRCQLKSGIASRTTTAEAAMDFPSPELMDEEACYERLVEILHPEGRACPRCQSREGFRVHRRTRAPVLDYHCSCGRVCNAFPQTVFRKTHRRPSEILLILRGIAPGTTTARLAHALNRHRQHLLHLRHPLQDPARQAADPLPLDDPVVEADERFQNAGEKGPPAHRPRRSAAATG